MAMPNAYAQYTINKVMTASKPELTLMLYDGAIKFCNIAIIAIEQEDFTKARTNIKKVELIIEEFRATLDMTYPVAQDFERVYVYLYKRLMEADTSKDKEILEEVNMHLRSMRDTWKEVMKKAQIQ